MLSVSFISLFSLSVRTCSSIIKLLWPLLDFHHYLTPDMKTLYENDPNAVITWCQENGLISEIKRCPEQGCNNVMTLANRTGKDGKTWRCQRPCRKTLSIRSGIFFEGSNLLISTIIKFTYNWAYEILDYKLAKREFNMGTHAFVDWKSFLCDICTEHFIRHPLRIGGPGVAVEIDESVFTRRKYNRGRMVMEQWVFGGIDTTTKQGFLVPVDQRNADTATNHTTIHFARHNNCF